MKRQWLCVVAIGLLAAALTSAQQSGNDSSNMLKFENGTLANGVYSNECLGFSLPIPAGWHQLVGVDARARHTAQGALVLLVIEQRKEGALGNTIILNANDASLYQSNVEGYVSNYARGHINVDPEHRDIVKGTYSVSYAGKIFFRADNKQTTSSGRALYVSFVYTKFRGYYIGEFLSAGSPEDLDQAANFLQQISFRGDEPDSKCVMSGDDGPNSAGTAGGLLSSKPDASQNLPQRVRVSEGVSTDLLVKRVPPDYPEIARRARVQGQVILQAEIDRNGDIQDLTLISGHPMLAPAAIKAVKQWKYKPYLLKGQPVAVETQIVVSFSLSGG